MEVLFLFSLLLENAVAPCSLFILSFDPIRYVLVLRRFGSDRLLSLSHIQLGHGIFKNVTFTLSHS